MKPRRPRPLLMALLLFPAASLVLGATGNSGEDGYLSGQFWWEADPFIGELESSFTLEDGLPLMLDEARWVFAGMIFGFDLLYHPPDPGRQVEELFELQPLGEVPWGDPSLKVLNAWPVENRFRADLEYRLSDYQRRLRLIWESAVLPSAGGQGSYTLFEGMEGRRKALERGVLQAVRSHFQARTRNRPRAIRGRVVLAEVPYVLIREGQYVSRVRIRMDLEVQDQGAY